MENIGTIYGILNIESLKIYVGQSKKFKYRKWSHKSKLKANKHHNDHLQHAYNKYGEDKFIFIILEKDIPTDILTARELHWINQKGSLNRDKGYNLAIPDPDCHHKHSDESKEKNRRDIYTRYYGEPESEEIYQEWKWSRKEQVYYKSTPEEKAKTKASRAIIYFDKETGAQLGEFNSTVAAARALFSDLPYRSAMKRIQNNLNPKTKNKSYRGYVFAYKAGYVKGNDYSFPTGRRAPNKKKV